MNLCRLLVVLAGCAALALVVSADGAVARSRVGQKALAGPAVTTGAASGVGVTNATVGGSFVTNNTGSFTYHFEYGKMTSYGSSSSNASYAAATAKDNPSVSASLSGLSPSTTYHYRLVVTYLSNDYAGGDQTFTTQAPPNQPPSASFTASQSALHLAVDASASADPDGSIASYDWDFGDGGSATGVTATHDYADPGTYTVKLTVTDNVGATDTASKSTTATLPPPQTVTIAVRIPVTSSATIPRSGAVSVTARIGVTARATVPRSGSVAVTARISVHSTATVVPRKGSR